MFEHILVATDGSPTANRAIDVAIDMVKCHGSRVCILHVIRDQPLPKEILDMISAGEITASRLDILRDSAEIILGKARRRFEEAGIDNVDTAFAIAGDPAYEISDYADTHGMDVIVVGYRGLNTRGNMLGSVVRKLLHVSEKSCLVIK